MGAPGIHYNLALARIHLDQPIAAYENLAQAIRYGPEPLKGRDRYDHALRYLALLRNQLAEVEVICDQPGATVTLDGKLLFTGPGRHRGLVLPGGHQILASAPGRIPATEQIVLAPGQRARFALAPRLPDQVRTERRWPMWKPWAVVGAGAIVMAAGSGANWRSSQGFDDVHREAERLCAGSSGCDAAPITAALRDQRSQAERTQTIARAIYVVGGTVLAGGAVLVYLNRERPVRRRAADTARVSVVPTLGPDAAGLSAHIHF